MDDQQGNVIDGTVRARNWRRRLKTRADDKAGAARSDAPKSIASSLLVPAEMLSAAVPVEADVTPPPGDELNAGGEISEQGTVASSETSPEAPGHRNPFLAPTAAAARTAGHTRRPTIRRWIAAFWGLMIRAACGVRGVSQWRSALARHPRWIPRLRPVVVGLTAAALIALGAELVVQTQANSTLRPQSSASTADSSAGEFSPGLLFSVPDSLRARLLAPRVHAERVRGVQKSRVVGKRSKAATPTGTTIVAYHSTPAAGAPIASTANAGPAPSSPTSSQPVEPSSPTATPVSQPSVTPQPAGPAGPGYVIGSQCNPKCR